MSRSAHRGKIANVALRGRDLLAPALLALGLVHANSAQAILAPTAKASVSPQAVLTGDTTMVTVTLTNPNPTPLAGVADTTTMPAGMTPVASFGTTCGGGQTLNSVSGGTATMSGGSLAANASCAFTFSATVAAAGGYSIPTGSPSASGAAAGFAGPPVMLTVNEPLGPSNNIALSPPSIYAGGTTTFTVTVTNPNNVPLNSVSNTVFPAPGTSFIVSLGTSSCSPGSSPGVQSVSAGAYNANYTMAANGICTYTGTLTSTLAGSYLISPGVPGAGGSLPGSSGAPVVFTVNPILPPSATVNLSPTSFASGGQSLATITLTNPNSIALAGVAHNVTPPAGTSFVAVPQSKTCNGTQNVSATSFTLSGATLAANASCTIAYLITSSTAGTYPVPSGTPSATGASASAPGPTAALTVKALLSPTTTISLSPTSMASGGQSLATVTLTNPNSVALTGVGDSVNAPLFTTFIGVLQPRTCNGAATVNASSYTLTGATLAANASCTISYLITSFTAGSYAMSTGSTSATGAIFGPEGTPAYLNVTSANQPLGPSTTIALSPTSIYAGGTTTFTATVTNPNNLPLTGVTNTVYPAPGTSFIVSLGTSSCSAGSSPGVQSVSAGAYNANYTMAANGICTFKGTLTSTLPGSYLISPGAPTASGALPGTTGPSATLTVNPILPPTTSISLSPTSITSGGQSLVTVTLTNPNSIALTGVANSITPPVGSSFIVALQSGTCNGVQSVSPGSFTLSGASLATNTSCTIGYLITSSTAGTYPAPSGTPSAAGASASAPGPTAALTVKALLAPTTTISLSPTSVVPGGQSLATVTLTNPNAVALTGISDNISAPFFTTFSTTPQARTCNGADTLTVNSYSHTGATLAANASCTIAYLVSSNTPGSYVLSTGSTTATGAAFGPEGLAAYLNVRIAQAVTFLSSPPAAPAIGGSYTPIASASSGLPVTIIVDPASSAVCSIAAGVVTFNAYGSCVLDAIQAGNPTFSPAFPVQQAINVGVPLSVTLAGSGSGQVTGSVGSGISCPVACSGSLPFGTVVTLTATPTNAGFVFTGWLGACTGKATCVVTMNAPTSVSATFAPAAIGTHILDIDNNTRYDALTDGLLIIRYMLGLTGTPLTASAIGGSPGRTDPTVILTYLNDIRPMLDVDGNGVVDPLTDGLLILRYMFGIVGNSLTQGAVGNGASRPLPSQIQAYLSTLEP